MNNDLISREALKKAIMELPNDNPSYYYTGDLLDRERVLDEIDNAPTVEYSFYQEAYQTGYEEGKNEKPQGDLADEVWKLYEKYQPRLATNVIEFGDELKDLLGKYQKGGAK